MKLVLLLLATIMAGPTAVQDVRVGSKAFTESVILGEMATRLAQEHGYAAEHVRGLGGTRLLWEALLAGQVDAYPEYTGTILEEILAGENVEGTEALRARLAEDGLRITDSLGFDNTYVLGMKAGRADELGIRTIGDLRDHPGLVLRFSNEFMQRADGWGALATRYRLPHEDVRGLEHALAYEALDGGMIDVTDLYATDAKILTLGLRRLEDDLHHFPEYQALFVYRADLDERAPAFVAALHGLAGTIDEAAMVRMNAAVEVDGESEAAVAARAAGERLGKEIVAREASLTADLVRTTREHLSMVLVSLLAAMIVSLPLGILAARHARAGQVILGLVGVIQTIPAIALLVLLIRPVSFLTGELGYPQAVVALFLYCLLPIVRNTTTGLRSIAPDLLESAAALGLPPRTILWRIELPLASRTILAGIKTAAVINVGFATLGGFIGAGGYGDPIFTGIRLNDYGIILQGAIPAALLALVVQGVFELIERRVVPRGLRLARAE